MRYRKRPVTVEAIQWTGQNLKQVVTFLDADFSSYLNVDEVIRIRTLEGVMDCPTGWWVIRGVAGEHYSCRPDVFDQTYEPLP